MPEQAAERAGGLAKELGVAAEIHELGLYEGETVAGHRRLLEAATGVVRIGPALRLAMEGGE